MKVRAIFWRNKFKIRDLVLGI